MVGRVSNLEDCGCSCSCSGSGCGGTVETRAFPESPKLAEKEGGLLEIGNLVAEEVYLKRLCWWKFLEVKEFENERKRGLTAAVAAVENKLFVLIQIRKRERENKMWFKLKDFKQRFLKSVD